MEETTGPTPPPSNKPVAPGLLVRKRVDPPSGADAESIVTLTGTVEQGVESRSIVLLDDARSPLAQLSGRSAENYPFGARVQVTGRFVTGLRTTAQQGRPFRVDELTVL